MTEFRTDEIFQTLKGPLRVIDNEEKRKQIESYIDAAQVPVELVPSFFLRGPQRLPLAFTAVESAVRS